ncbi:MAG: histidinol-phosphatase HisJ family protein [Acutalibacteraceae bacterium]
MYCDFHTHTSFSSDGKADPELQILRAIELDMKKFCITDHEDIGYPPEYGLPFTVDIDKYFDTLKALKEKYADKISVLIGIELGLQPRLTQEQEAFVQSRDFDFVIGSTHLVGGEDPCYPGYFGRYSQKEGIRKYLEQVLKNIKSFNDFDVVGHIDYIVRYTADKGAGYNCADFRDVTDEILKYVVENGKGIECNTSRLGCGLLHCNPHEDIIRRYRELGGEIITLGSDSHTPDTLGHEFRKAGEILKEAGFKYYTVFEKRNPEFLKL